MDNIILPELIAENESLKAENARLQAIIDEANAQEPIGVFNGKFNVSINDKITFEVNCYDALPEAGARLYASPIPAQQSPAVAVPDENAWIIEKLSYHKFERNDLNIDGCLNFLESEWKEIQGRTTRQLVMQILELLASAPSPSITEQDAREIYKVIRDIVQNYECGDKVDSMLRPLLNKLNNNHNMSLNVDEAIKQLSENMRSALQAGEVVLAVKIQEKISQLIEYSTKIPA